MIKIIEEKMSAEQKPEKQMMESAGKFKPETNLSLGENVERLAKVTGGYQLMDEDNKKMLEKVKEAKTNEEVIQTLMTDPNNGRSMSYAESRMRFG
jgi:hypothetical protein